MRRHTIHELTAPDVSASGSGIPDSCRAGDGPAIMQDQNRWEDDVAWFRVVLDSSIDAIVTIDDAGAIETANTATSRIFGYDHNELIGRNISMLMAEPDRSAHDRYIKAYIDTGHAKIIGRGREVECERKGGIRFPADLAVSEARLGNRRIFAGIIRDITERKEAERQHALNERRELVMGELNHRMGNLFAVVMTMVRLTGRLHSDVESYQEALESRLHALSRTQSLLTRPGTNNTTLQDLVEAELAAYGCRKQLGLSGPSISLGCGSVQSFSMIIHELATNAVKYGALSTVAGKVSIGWRIEGSGTDAFLVFQWIEQQGPKVSAPKRQGFGTTILEKSIHTLLGGAAQAEYVSEGLRYMLRVPTERLG
jgi:PAS domain S-box-containing protein